MAQLAIKGHATRGREVIELLEILGGRNMYQINAHRENCVYFIDKDEIIRLLKINQLLPEQFIVFTLEEFIEKFPYKVGDKVNYVKYDDKHSNVYTIQMVRWTGVTIEYLLDSSGFSALTKDLQPYKEETMEERYENAVNHVYETEVISFDIAQRDKYELDLQGKFEVVLREGKYYVERIKPKYPKTYEECCAVLFPNTIDLGKVSAYGYKDELLTNLGELIICRDAYWKIAGWNPKVKSDVFYMDTLPSYLRDLFPMPTKEMRDAFKENFEELIKECNGFL